MGRQFRQQQASRTFGTAPARDIVIHGTVSPGSDMSNNQSLVSAVSDDESVAESTGTSIVSLSDTELTDDAGAIDVEPATNNSEDAYLSAFAKPVASNSTRSSAATTTTTGQRWQSAMNLLSKAQERSKEKAAARRLAHLRTRHRRSMRLAAQATKRQRNVNTPQQTSTDFNEIVAKLDCGFH